MNGDNVKFAMRKHTKKWLKENSIRFDSIRFEKGNVDRPVAGFYVKYHTRFYYAAKKKIMFFVEDNLQNALRLAQICKYVFLIDHSYNQNTNNSLPYNIIRVSNWAEIYQLVKKLD